MMIFTSYGAISYIFVGLLLNNSVILLINNKYLVITSAMSRVALSVHKSGGAICGLYRYVWLQFYFVRLFEFVNYQSCSISV